jgi:hypothetical protein
MNDLPKPEPDLAPPLCPGTDLADAAMAMPAPPVTVVTYPGTYIDPRGREILQIVNDGATLVTTIRGVRFAGRDFDSLAPAADTPGDQLLLFTLSSGELCACKFTFEIPLPLVVHGRPGVGTLHVELDLGRPAPRGGIDHEHLRLSFAHGDSLVTSSGLSGLFENELLELQSRLPQDVHLKACINCLFSDYSPYGQGLFGNMLCFRNIKEEYLRVTSKVEFWEVHGRQDRQVQETFLCEQFQLRIAGTGYRG